MSSFVTIALLFCIALSASAAKLDGKVIDIGNDGAGLAGVAVTVQQAGHRAGPSYTDSSGKYSVAGLLPGEATVSFDKVKYGPRVPVPVLVKEPSSSLVREMYQADADSAYVMRVAIYQQLKPKTRTSEFTSTMSESLSKFAAKLQRYVMTEAPPPTPADLKDVQISPSAVGALLQENAVSSYLTSQKEARLVRDFGLH